MNAQTDSPLVICRFLLFGNVKKFVVVSEVSLVIHSLLQQSHIGELGMLKWEPALGLRYSYIYPQVSVLNLLAHPTAATQ